MGYTGGRLSRFVLQLLMYCLCCVSLFNAGAQESERVALVIGNGDYRTMALKNPGNDANAIARSLSRLGFKTQLLIDANWQTMIESVRTWLMQTQDSPVRVLFYAGHGAQIRGRNYLVPVDADIADEDDVRKRSIDLTEILDHMGRATKALNIAIIDACRTNPMMQTRLTSDGRKIKVRSQTHGLAAMTPPVGTLVAFSTSPGNVAVDNGNEATSLYTKHLLTHLETPGITLEQLFKRVRVGVMQESNNKQRPWEESSLTVEFCLQPGSNQACLAAATP